MSGTTDLLRTIDSHGSMNCSTNQSFEGVGMRLYYKLVKILSIAFDLESSFGQINKIANSTEKILKKLKFSVHFSGHWLASVLQVGNKFRKILLVVFPRIFTLRSSIHIFFKRQWSASRRDRYKYKWFEDKYDILKKIFIKVLRARVIINEEWLPRRAVTYARSTAAAYAARIKKLLFGTWSRIVGYSAVIGLL